MNDQENNKKPMPRGGRKGGSVFPRVALKDALIYAKKLVTKTHVARIPRDVLLTGVTGAKSGTGEIRASAMKQYGFVIGDTKNLFGASDLAKKIGAAPPDEIVLLYQQAALNPAIFKGLAQTFHGDTVSKAKLKQRASDLKVHPEETEACVDIYISSMLTAELVTVDGEQITHLVTGRDAEAVSDTHLDDSNEVPDEPDESQDAIQQDGDDHDAQQEGGPVGGINLKLENKIPRAVFNVNVQLDASLDTEKLEKQLALLKKYGAI